VVVTSRAAGEVVRPRRRRVYFPEAGKYLDTPVLSRYGLKPRQRIAGPAVIEERESTVVIGPAGTATVDRDLNLVIRIG
jgi:N-methylhydantoinase A